MLENTGDATKRQPSSRNRALNRRHSRDRFDRVSGFTNDNGEKDGAYTNNNVATLDRGGLSGTNNNNSENLLPGLVSINGCSNSEAMKLMNERWAAAMHSHNDQSLDVTERPVVYLSSGGGSVWGSSKLAYQPSVMDFLGEMGHAIRRANLNQVNGERKSGTR
eukprot:Gb_29048 [translate_table: standard]